MTAYTLHFLKTKLFWPIARLAWILGTDCANLATAKTESLVLNAAAGGKKRVGTAMGGALSIGIAPGAMARGTVTIAMAVKRSR
jgi:hypothetical protein